MLTSLQARRYFFFLMMALGAGYCAACAITLLQPGNSFAGNAVVARNIGAVGYSLYVLRAACRSFVGWLYWEPVSHAS